MSDKVVVDASKQLGEAKQLVEGAQQTEQVIDANPSDEFDPEIDNSIGALPNFGPRNPELAAGTDVATQSVPAVDAAPVTEVSAEHAESHAGNDNDVEIADLPSFGPKPEKVAEKEVQAEKAASDVSAGPAVEVAAAAAEKAAPDDALPVAEAGKRQESDRAFIGVLIEHGPAKFDFNPAERKESYFVKLMTIEGEQIVWGRDLKRATAESGAKIGDTMLLADMGSREVIVDADILDSAGNVVGTEKKPAQLHSWDASVVPPTLEAAPAKVAVTGNALNSAVDAALKATVGQVMAPVEPAAEAPTPKSVFNDAQLKEIAEHLNIQGGIRSDQMVSQPAAQAVAGPAVSKGQQVQAQGVNALAEGASSLLGGTMSLVGAAARGVGNIAHGLASAVPTRTPAGKAPLAAPAAPEQSIVEGFQQTAGAPVASGTVAPAPSAPVAAPVVAQGSLPAVLPRLSEYRILRAEEAAKQYSQSRESFWNSSEKLVAVQAEMQEISRERNIPMQDVCKMMAPGGELAELRTKFNDGLTDNPDAAKHRKAMDKALDSYVRTFDRAQEELVNPEQKANPHYEGLKSRLDKSHEELEKDAAGVPAFQNDKGELEPSHLEKLREAVAAIMEKVKEILRNVFDTLRGKRGDDNAPAP